MLNMVGGTIQMIRIENGISIEELAAAVGVSPFAIKKYEENVWLPGASVLKKIADYFNMTITEIENGYSIIYDQTTGEKIVIRRISDNQFEIISRTKISV